MHFPPDPSWCARINAHRAPPPDPAPPPPASDPQPVSRAAPDAVSDPAAAPPSASPFRPREIPTRHDCEICGTVMYDHNCKIVCPNCGYKRDCSDP
jgi:hypothetical protein